MTNELPVIFIHNGPSWYLPYVVNQARRANPGSDTVLLGNDAFVEGPVYVDSGKYSTSPRVQAFTRVYRHMSPNTYEFELFCFQRWFYLLEYMVEANIDMAFHLDSDCMLYNSAERIRAWIGEGYRCGLSIPKQSFESLYWCASGHISFWTRECLESFCDFAISTYTDSRLSSLYEKKWSDKSKGGICDMTALYLFYLENKPMVFNMASEKNEFVCDHNINDGANVVENEYRTYCGIKRIQFEGDIPQFINISNRHTVNVHALHCQGSAKMFIPLYYRGESLKMNILKELSLYVNIGKARLIYTIKAVLRPLKRYIFRILNL